MNSNVSSTNPPNPVDLFNSIFPQFIQNFKASLPPGYSASDRIFSTISFQTVLQAKTACVPSLFEINFHYLHLPAKVIGEAKRVMNALIKPYLQQNESITHRLGVGNQRSNLTLFSSATCFRQDSNGIPSPFIITNPQLFEMIKLLSENLECK